MFGTLVSDINKKFDNPFESMQSIKPYKDNTNNNFNAKFITSE